MHSRTSWFIVFLALILLVPGAMAFAVSSTTVDPDILNPGDPVNVTSTVYAASGTAFSAYDDLQMVTVLDDPVWTYTIIVNDVQNVRPVEIGKTLTIAGYELSYRNQDEVVVKVSLKGRVPATTSMGSTISILKFQELDARSKVITSSVVDITHLVGQPTPTPTPGYGSIEVSSKPSGANVYLDNTIKGISPMTINAVPNGGHTVLLRLEGYEDYSRAVTVMADAVQVDATLTGKSATPPATEKATTAPATGATAVTATQQPAIPVNTGSLSVTTSPAGALVYIDGKMRGITPATIPGLSPGTHTIELILDGYQDLETTTEITAGASSEFVTGLSKRKQLPGFTGVLVLVAAGLLLGVRAIRNKKP